MDTPMIIVVVFVMVLLIAAGIYVMHKKDHYAQPNIPNRLTYASDKKPIQMYGGDYFRGTLPNSFPMDGVL